MTVTVRTAIAGGATVMAMALGYALSARPQPTAPSDQFLAAPASVVKSPTLHDRRPVFRSGCSASACHGAPATRALSDEPGPLTWTTAATQWHARDPHVNATEVLDGPLARRMMQRLRAERPERWAAEALDEVRCLACHTNPALANGTERPDRVRLRTEGVTCEACHGNASGWLLEHTGWSGAERPDRYQSLGMTKLYEVGERAATCAGCHVGAPADPARGYPLRDMNHDMIAAGHPRLYFEFADSQRRLPPHWFERDRTRDSCPPREPEFEARAWLVGRVASAEAACRLLADRAERATRDDGAEWPELSETRCFACHRELLPNAWRPARGRARPAAWQTVWPLTRPEHFAAVVALRGGKSSEAGSALAGVEKEFARRAPRAPETARSATRAADALRGLRAELAALPDRDATKTVLGLYSRVRADGLDWDESCQVAQGLFSLEWVRLRRAVPPRRVPNPLFAELASGLALPRPDGTDHFDSPRRFDPRGPKDDLNRLLGSVLTDCAAELK